MAIVTITIDDRRLDDYPHSERAELIELDLRENGLALWHRDVTLLGVAVCDGRQHNAA